MNLYTIFSIILTFAVLIGYINYHFVKIQTTIAITIGALILSSILIIAGELGFTILTQNVATMLEQASFPNLLINYMLSFLLFAGAIRTDFNFLRSQKWEIATLAGIGTIVSTFFIAVLIYYSLEIFHIHIDFIYCLLFGALISPTDPIAVLATFKEVNVPKKLAVIAEGESLFNDGVAIVIFLTIYHLSFGSEPVTLTSTTLLFLRQTFGGILYGGLLGVLAYRLIKSVSDHKLQTLITILIVTAGYTSARFLHVSGPLAMVSAGILVGNYCRRPHMNQKTAESLSFFWELVEEILNTTLFLFIGLELLIIDIDKYQIIAALLAIPLVILIRAIIVSIFVAAFKTQRHYPKGTTRILIWGGLRGGLALALALALPLGHYRNLVLGMTYATVTFSIIVQGLTIKSLIKLTK